MPPGPIPQPGVPPDPQQAHQALNQTNPVRTILGAPPHPALVAVPHAQGEAGPGLETLGANYMPSTTRCYIANTHRGRATDPSERMPLCKAMHILPSGAARRETGHRLNTRGRLTTPGAGKQRLH